MPKGYHHLTYEERCQIYTLKKSTESNGKIAKRLGVDKSTITRELNRNKGGKGYRFKQAHIKSCERRFKACRKKHKMTKETIALIENKLREQWSPEQISGWIKITASCNSVSAETIYQHIWDNKRRGGNLFKHLRHSGKKYNKRSSEKAGRGCIPNRVDIKDRPSIVDEKSRLGDWEVDTVIGKGHKGVIVSMVERASKLTKLVVVRHKTAKEVCNALIIKLDPVKKFVLTITADNGKEFATHEIVSNALESTFFFATPYHSWERGLNEHTNGLLRQYVPKDRALDDLTQEELDRIEMLLNTRPRKVLNYKTPLQAFNSMMTAA